MMLIAQRQDCVVRHVAGPVEQRLGVITWQNEPLGTLIGRTLSDKIAALVQPDAVPGLMGQLQTISGEILDVSAYLTEPYLVVELEPASAQGLPALHLLDRLSAAAERFEWTASLGALCERAAVEFRHLTGFDRVMVYRFLEDGVGRVVAEDRQPGMHSFLNHHFPASDIPQQARALYLRNLIRVIPEVSYQPAALRPGWKAPTQLDMSDSSLRSVSPVHLQYLKNMNVSASASVSIVKDGMLWGLIACHHETPRLLSYDVRAACRLLAGSVARQIKAKEEAEGYRQRIRLRGFEDDMVALLSRQCSLDLALSNHLSEMRKMMDGDGVAILRGTELVMQGACPSEAEIRALATWIPVPTVQLVFSTAHLAEIYPPAAAFQRIGSGLLAVILSTDEPWLLLWFRAEQEETVNWAGNPHKPYTAGPLEPLTPRDSFAAWQETVRGHARDWTPPELDAAIRLRAALADLQQNRRMRELNIQLTKILQEKDVLLQQNEFLIGEVNHRVQNSLQLVSSYLALSARTSTNPDLLDALQEARRRISAVSLVHRRLYRSDQIQTIDAARYIEELCTDTFSFMGPDWSPHLSLSLSPVMVSTDRAVTLGLLLTELLINTNKYAYDGAAGPIEVELTQHGPALRLAVADKGSGRVAYTKGFGSRIMEGLTSQLGGKLAYSDNQPGLRVVITIPVKFPAQLEQDDAVA